MDSTSQDGPELIPSFLSAFFESDDVEPQLHLCPLCDTPIQDPLEECPVCAATLDERESLS